MTPDDNAQAGEELNERTKRQVENIFQKSQDFDGKTQKTKLTKADNQIVDALSNSNSELVEAGDIKTGKTPVVVIPDLTQELIDSRAFSFLYHYTYGNDKEDAINEGLRLGTMLGKKLKVRGEEKDLVFTRQNTGKINKRLISELGFGNSNVFSQIVKEKYNRANLHLSIDASGSMSGGKLTKAMTSAVAMVKACEMAGNINVVVSFRWTSKDKPVVIICYDSRKDKINKLRSCGRQSMLVVLHQSHYVTTLMRSG